MSAPAWVDQMDQLAEAGIPFLFILDFELEHPIITPLSELSKSERSLPLIKYSIGSEDNSNSKSLRIDNTKSPVAFEMYQKGFEQALDAIRAGDTYLLNLCYATHLPDMHSLNEVYDAVKAPYKLLLEDQFVVFSPEQFVSVKDGVIRTFPMKGTIDAATPNAASELMNDKKEQEEHATVVDLLRNDLSIVADNVRVNNYRFITRIDTADRSLLQCSSEISGLLTDDYVSKPGSMMQALLPAGSVTGAPKKRTVELIKAIEPDNRNYFTGVFGVFDGKDLDSAVMIRMIEQREDGFFYRSGGGLTYQSEAGLEYQEMIDKVYIPV